MAEVVGLVASAITVGAAAAQISLALFKVAHTFKYAPEEILEIASETSIMSDSLMVLADILQAYQGICKPELFRQVREILNRYEQIKKQLQKITSARTKLQRLKWFFDAPKAKSMLKKVESIKSSLTLILSILRLAIEEVARRPSDPQPNQLHHQQSPLPLNRFRKTAESVVQANRLTVVRADKDNVDQPTWKRRRRNYELNRYEADSHDAATWLYHLVFTTGTISSNQTSQHKRLEPHSATVEDYDSDTSVKVLVSEPEKNKETSDESRAIIVWNKSTEPSEVVDRLLRSWTVLYPQQIEDSRAYYTSVQDEKWRDELVERIQAYEKQKHKSKKEDSDLSDDSLDVYDYDDKTEAIRPRPSNLAENSDEDDYQSAEENSVVESDVLNAPTEQDLPDQYRGHIYYGSNAEQSRSDTHRRPHRLDSRFERQNAGAARLVGTGHYKRENKLAQDPWANSNPFDPRANINPFDLEYSRFADVHSSASNRQTVYPAHTTMPPVPELPQPMPPYFAPLPVHPDQAADDKIMATLEKMLAEKATKDANEDKKASDMLSSRLERFEELLARELALSKKDDHVGSPPKPKPIFDLDNTHNQDRLSRLEQLLIEQRDDQLRRHLEAEAAWRAEKAKSDAEARKNAQEAKELMEKEISEAKAAKKAAEKALKFAKEQAANRARREAEEKAMEERRKVEEDYRKRIERYENQLAAFTEQWQDFATRQTQTAPPAPMRRTYISKGDQKIEISEFNSDGLDPLLMPQAISASFFQDDFVDTRSLVSKDKTPPRLAYKPRDSFSAWSESAPSARPILSGTPQNMEVLRPSQNVIVLSSQLDKGSLRTTEMQSSLGRLGVLTTFDDQASDANSALVRGDSQGEELVNSTVFWEPPSRSLGSELLSTLRYKGWKPFYTRASDAGQTFFLGNRPIHVHFFKPEYQPQFNPSVAFSSSEHVLIAKDFVEEYALLELGFEFTPTDSGAYALDCRLTASDIQALIERSFIIKETGFRRVHRLLHWKTPLIQGTAPSAASEAEDYEPSLASEITTTSKSQEYGDQHSDALDETPITSPSADNPAQDSLWKLGDMELEVYDRRKAGTTDAKMGSAESTGIMERNTQLRLRAVKSKSHVD